MVFMICFVVDKASVGHNGIFGIILIVLEIYPDIYMIGKAAKQT